MEIKKEGRAWALYLRLPFAEKDRIQVFTRRPAGRAGGRSAQASRAAAHAGRATGEKRRVYRAAAARRLRSQGGVVSGGKGESGKFKKPCCMVSEILEEAGIDRERARQIRQQVLEGVVLMCQWQLQRMQQDRPGGAEDRPGGGAAARSRWSDRDGADQPSVILLR